MPVVSADNSKPSLTTPNQRAAEMLAKRDAANADQSNWEWVTVPATDLFGDPNNGITINFVKYCCELDDEGRATGNEGRYFVNPEIAKELRRMLDVKLRAEMRVMQPGQDKAMMKAMAKSALGAPDRNPGRQG